MRFLLILISYLLVAALSFSIGACFTQESEFKSQILNVLKGQLFQARDAEIVEPSLPQLDATEGLTTSWDDMTVDGLAITQALIDRISGPENKLVYDLTLVNKGRRYIGNMAVTVSGTRPGRSGVEIYQGLGDDGPRAQSAFMNVSNFLRTRGEIPLPQDFKPKIVFVKLLEHGEIRASKAVWVPEADSSREL